MKTLTNAVQMSFCVTAVDFLKQNHLNKPSLPKLAWACLVAVVAAAVVIFIPIYLWVFNLAHSYETRGFIKGCLFFDIKSCLCLHCQNCSVREVTAWAQLPVIPELKKQMAKTNNQETKSLSPHTQCRKCISCICKENPQGKTQQLLNTSKEIPGLINSLGLVCQNLSKMIKIGL